MVGAVEIIRVSLFLNFVYLESNADILTTIAMLSGSSNLLNTSVGSPEVTPFSPTVFTPVDEPSTLINDNCGNSVTFVAGVSTKGALITAKF